MTTTSKLGNEFLRIPKLDVSGSNWVLYKERFFWSLDARAILEHIDGTGREPANPITDSIRAKGALTAEQTLLDMEWRKDLKEWKQGEAVTSKSPHPSRTHFS
jgi:hypothetical protein